MFRHTVIRGAVIGAFAALFVLYATPVFAQAMGSVRGTVVDEAGKPVPEAEVIFDFVGDVQISLAVKANSAGGFIRNGLRTGQWRVQAQKGKLLGSATVTVTPSDQTRMEPITIKEPTAASTAAATAAGMSAKEVEARNAAMKAIQADFEAAVTSIPTDPDGAIAKITEITKQIPQCAVCFAKIGDAYMKKNDLAGAETAYKQAITFDDKMADPYSGLAILYNQQKKFDEAAKMGSKANELLGGTATGGDPAAIFNQGIILWNAGGKAAEAKAQFEAAIKIDPKMADAHYWLGMCNINLGQLPDAVKNFEEYLKLAPSGQYAEMSKGILKSIKG
jgi:tetratricopeptide (TPR) repeat protein